MLADTTVMLVGGMVLNNICNECFVCLAPARYNYNIATLQKAAECGASSNR